MTCILAHVFKHCYVCKYLFFLCRCEDAEAFEVQDGGKSTGIFTKYLNKHILQSEKVTHVLEKVSEGTYLEKHKCVIIYDLITSLERKSIQKIY